MKILNPVCLMAVSSAWLFLTILTLSNGTTFEFFFNFSLSIFTFFYGFSKLLQIYRNR